MSFVGVTIASMTARNNMMNQICYDRVGLWLQFCADSLSVFAAGGVI